MNSDGYRDLLVGSPVTQANGQMGRVRMYSGRDMSLLFELKGSFREFLVGMSVATIGDVDSDGVPEFVVGMPGRAAISIGGGQAQLLSGKTGKVIHAVLPGATDEFLGFAVSAAGDVDGDRVEDFLVGAPTSSASARSSGVAYAISGRTGKAIHRLVGSGVGSQLGISVAAMGDVDGDGYSDFCVGANGDLQGGWPNYVGSATAFSGKTGKKIYKVWGTKPNDSFGFSLAAIRDVDGDAIVDIVIGAPQSIAVSGAGYVRVISGKTGRKLLEISGARGGDEFGYSVCGIGDIDGDRIPDFCVGAPQRGPILPAGSGYVSVFSGKSGANLFTLSPGNGEQGFGQFVGGSGDLNEDGVQDFVVTSKVKVSSGSLEDHILIYSTKDLALVADRYQLPLGQAGTQTMKLDAGPAHAGSMYWMLGSATGTRVGIHIPGLRIPLDYDVYTEFLIGSPNATVLPNSRGFLDRKGSATANFIVPAGVPPMKGFSIYHAFIVFDRQGRWTLASNPALLRLN